MAKSESITGRDASIVCKALAYAIRTIELLPFDYRENSDMQDMKKLLEHYATDTYGVGFYMENARCHMEEDAFDPVKAGYEMTNVVSLVDHLRKELGLDE